MNSLVETTMLFLLIVIIVAIVYVVFVLFPKKLKLIKKYGNHLTNDDFIDLAKRENPDVKEVVVKTKYALIAVVICGVVLIVLNHVFKG
jgi:uncharacterized membrane protein YukC